jgi:UDP-glucose 4-epimerase
MYLITGATGFVGKALLKRLEIDNLSFRGLSRTISNRKFFIQCDLLEESDLNQAIFKDVTTVIHMAGYTHDLSDSNEKYPMYYDLNVEVTTRLANMAAESGVSHFIFVSSVKASGSKLSDKCHKESDQGNPHDIYGKTKRLAELELLDLGGKSNMRVSIIRPSLVYGPNVKGNLELMLRGIKGGWFPPLPKSENKRSMVHVDDLVRAIVLVAKNQSINGEIFTITDGKHYSAYKIYNTLCDASGKRRPQLRIPKVLFDVASYISPSIQRKVDKLFGNDCYCSSRINSLGFKAKKSLRDINKTSYKANSQHNKQK